MADSDSDDDDGADITFDPVHLYKQILDYLQPGETVSKALCRLGKFYYFTKYNLFYSRLIICIYIYLFILIFIFILSLGKGKKRLTNAERWKRKKEGKSLQTDDHNSAQITKLTELANELLTRTGNMDIYQESYEQINKKVKYCASHTEMISLYVIYLS